MDAASLCKCKVHRYSQARWFSLDKIMGAVRGLGKHVSTATACRRRKHRNCTTTARSNVLRRRYQPDSYSNRLSVHAKV
jgi:hypothetical protein